LELAPLERQSAKRFRSTGMTSFPYLRAISHPITGRILKLHKTNS
jgi:hypothetical protein